MEHEIRTYLNINPVHQNIQPVHSQKEETIKDEVENLLKSSFIYLVSLMEWLSNPILVDKKQGTICICSYLWDLNKACPKDNYPMHFIDHIIDACAGRKVFLFMGGFSGYNQI